MGDAPEAHALAVEAERIDEDIQTPAYDGGAVRPFERRAAITEQRSDVEPAPTNGFGSMTSQGSRSARSRLPP